MAIKLLFGSFENTHADGMVNDLGVFILTAIWHCKLKLAGYLV